MTLPLIRMQPWYPGQMGVEGSDVPLGMRWGSTAITMWVDPDHPGATDTGDGTDPVHPLETIQQAITTLTAHQTAQGASMSGSVIVLGGMAYTETVTIPAAAPNYCTLLGGGPSGHRPTWASGAAAQNCLTVQSEGWVIQGIEFNCPASAAGIRVEEHTVNGTNAYKTIIRDCVFDGLWSGLYGIDFYGSPHRIQILNNWFIEMNQGDDSAFCIMITDTAVGPGNPYQCAIIGNRFSDSDNYIGNLGSIRGFNVSLFQGNVFETGVLLTPTIYLDLRGGSRGDNIVTGNVFCGTYSIAGGYAAHAGNPGMWVGNIAEDVASPQVADNGFTVAVPA